MSQRDEIALELLKSFLATPVEDVEESRNITEDWLGYVDTTVTSSFDWADAFIRESNRRAGNDADI